MNERLVNYIEESFLKPLLEIDTITDISYNGVSIFYMDNILGSLSPSSINVSGFISQKVLQGLSAYQVAVANGF